MTSLDKCQEFFPSNVISERLSMPALLCCKLIVKKNKMKNLKNATELYQLINSGKLMDGFEKFYHPNVVMQEVGEAPRNGKDANREYEKNFFGMIKEFHGSGVSSITSNEAENKTTVESWMDITFNNDATRVKMEQVAVQTWIGNQIIKEVFYHK